MSAHIDIEAVIASLGPIHGRLLMEGSIGSAEAILDAADALRAQFDEINRLTAKLADAEGRLRRNCRMCGGSGIAMASGGTGDAVHTTYPCWECSLSRPA